jgi:DNA-directed RNA polymerase specialized sigma24 family protein
VDALARHRPQRGAHAPAFLAAATTRLAINASQSAHARRETRMGAWLAERVDAEADPARHAARTADLRSLEQLLSGDLAASVPAPAAA